MENPLAKRIYKGEFGAKDTVKIAGKSGANQFGKGRSAELDVVATQSGGRCALSTHCCPSLAY